jgi:threonine aldolase
VIFEIQANVDSEFFLNILNNKGVKLISMGDNKLRLVTHLNYTDQMHKSFLKILNDLNF